MKNEILQSPTGFISYNHRDLEAAQGVYDALQKLGCRATLIDRVLDVQTDDELKTILRRTAAPADGIVVLLTPNSLRSSWVGFERLLGELGQERIIYVCSEISLLGAMLRTHFLPHEHSGFKVIKRLRASRRYVSFGDSNWNKIVMGHLSKAAERRSESKRGGLKQFLFSYGSVDQIAINAAFNFVENRAVLHPSSLLVKAGLLFCMLLQVNCILAVPIFFVSAAILAWTIFR